MNYCDEIAAAMKKVRVLHIRIENGEKHLRGELSCTERLITELQQRAATNFAILNGWKHSTADFAPGMLLRGSTQRKRSEYGIEGCWAHEVFDHPVHFRETRPPYRPVAIVGQPYNTDITSARVIAMRNNLDLHAPPNLTASWWFPGLTRFFCCTRARKDGRVPARSVRLECEWSAHTLTLPLTLLNKPLIVKCSLPRPSVSSSVSPGAARHVVGICAGQSPVT